MCTVLCAIITSACIDDNDAVERETVSIPVNLYIPVDQGVTTKTPGDPGTTEPFSLPRYAYIYFVLNYTPQGGTNRTEIFRAGTGGVVDLGATPAWQKQKYNGPLAQAGDSIYHYKGNIIIDTPVNTRQWWAHVYAAVSKEALEITPLAQTEYTAGVSTDPADIDDDPAITAVRNIKFVLSGKTALQSSLQNLYSSPYNYKVGSPAKYYGTVSNITSPVMNVNLVLYHVAAKVDLIWNVATSQQSSLRITEITAENQYAQDAYLFRPMENIRTADDETGYATSIISNDVGSQWMGRAYYYTIPFRDTDENGKFNIRLRLRKNGETTKCFLPEFQNALPSMATSIFTPWVRGDLTINTVFDTKSDDDPTLSPTPYPAP